MSDDITLRALAVVELIGQPISPDTVDSLTALVADPDCQRVALRLAALLHCVLESLGTDVEAWTAEYRRRELHDELGGMA